MQTRKETANVIIGQPCELPANQLPIAADICRAYLWYTKILKSNNTQETASKITNQVKEMYARGSIPTIKTKSINNRITNIISKFQAMSKYSISRRKSKSYEKEVKSLHRLFDVCSCKCFGRGIEERAACICPLADKIPVGEWDFWKDQNTTRQLFIGNIDKSATRTLINRLKRSSINAFSQSVNVSGGASKFRESSVETAPSSENGLDYSTESTWSDDGENNRKLRNTLEYPELCKAMDRCKISNRDGCLVANALLKDLGMLTSQTALDPAKLRRQRKVMRQNVVNDYANETKELLCIGFDGKRDKTLFLECGIRRTVKEEHCVLVSFPQGKYIDHVVPDTGKAIDVAQKIISVIKDTNSVCTLSGLVCDGTVGNTGIHGGVIRKVEESLGRPLQWLICLFHTNELPFRKYISVVSEGRTTGPSSSTSELTSKLDFDPMSLPLSEFAPVAGRVINCSDQVKRDLSWDQLYLLRACLAVQTGYANCDDRTFIKTATPGKFHNARWLTTANRFLRLYMSQKHSSEALRRIVRFIVNVYAPSWFNIKTNSSCLNGATNFYLLIKWCYELGNIDWEIVEPVLQNNSYFAHPENILLAAIADNTDDYRFFALQRILTARHLPSSNDIRIFTKDNIKINPGASSYIDMINWNEASLTSPPLLSGINNEELLTYSFESLQNIPCHSQAVERSVQDISSTALKVVGHAARHGMAIQTKKSRTEMPYLQSKYDFL